MSDTSPKLSQNFSPCCFFEYAAPASAANKANSYAVYKANAGPDIAANPNLGNNFFSPNSIATSPGANAVNAAPPPYLPAFFA